MTVKQTTVLALALCSLLAAVDACRQPAPTEKHVSAPSQHKYAQNGSVREMTITPEDTPLPQGEGKAELEMYCGICHSLKYITSQPPFSRRTWAAEVHKMVEKYGAPVDSVNAEKIANYLVAINGTGG